jgi:hypothetical protein
MALWYAAVNVNDDWKTAADKPRAYEETPTKFQDRFPERAKDRIACRQPCMTVDAEGPFDANEFFELPTIEPERILGPDYPRSFPTPTLDMAIQL